MSAVPAATVAHVASLLLEFAARIDPADLLRVSPGRVEAFLEWLPAALRGKPDGAEPTASTQADSSVRSSEVTAVGLEVGPRDVAAVVRAWTAWAARQAGTPLLTRDLLAQAVDEILDDYLRAA